MFHWSISIYSNVDFWPKIYLILYPSLGKMTIHTAIRGHSLTTLPFLPPTYPGLTFGKEFLYLHRLVNVVCEWPLMRLLCYFHFFLLHRKAYLLIVAKNVQCNIVFELLFLYFGRIETFKCALRSILIKIYRLQVQFTSTFYAGKCALKT